MADIIPEDWWIEETGETNILDRCKVRAEIERMKAENERLHERMRDLSRENEELRAEIQRQKRLRDAAQANADRNYKLLMDEREYTVRTGE